MVLLEEVAAARDQVGLGVAGALDDPDQGRPKIITPLLRTDAEKALTREGPVEVQVSEVKQAKGHITPMSTRILPGAMALAGAKQGHYKGCARQL